MSIRGVADHHAIFVQAYLIIPDDNYRVSIDVNLLFSSFFCQPFPHTAVLLTYSAHNTDTYLVCSSSVHVSVVLGKLTFSKIWSGFC